MLARRGPTAELTTLWRFHHPWEARASLELRRGSARALDLYADHGAFTAGPHEAMLDAALGAAATADERGRVAILQAVDTRTVNELNARARSDRILTGQVSRDGGVTLHDGLIAGAGDRVLTRRNNRHLRTPDGSHVRNGTLWDVAAVLPDGGLLVNSAGGAAATSGDAEGGAVVRLPAAYVAEHVELCYATTTARSQGITVEESHTLTGPGMGREDLYVAMTRGRSLNRTYITLEDPDDECPPHAATAPAVPGSAREALQTILATSHAERSATETWHDYHPEQPPPLPPMPADRASALRIRTGPALPPTAAPIQPGGLGR
jgi:hypothetical protein